MAICLIKGSHYLKPLYFTSQIYQIAGQRILILLFFNPI
jgi:hypothetical protein